MGIGALGLFGIGFPALNPISTPSSGGGGAGVNSIGNGSLWGLSNRMQGIFGGALGEEQAMEQALVSLLMRQMSQAELAYQHDQAPVQDRAGAEKAQGQMSALIPSLSNSDKQTIRSIKSTLHNEFGSQPSAEKSFAGIQLLKQAYEKGQFSNKAYLQAAMSEYQSRWLGPSGNPATPQAAAEEIQSAGGSLTPSDAGLLRTITAEANRQFGMASSRQKSWSMLSALNDAYQHGLFTNQPFLCSSFDYYNARWGNSQPATPAQSSAASSATPAAGVAGATLTVHDPSQGATQQNV